MGLFDTIKSLFRKKEAEPVPQPQAQPARLQKTCRNCGKTFTVDPSWEFVPNYCKECKKKFIAEKEEKQRAGAPRKIRRKCKSCGNYFAFPSTLEHYPNYCPNCRKKHQAAMKAKYSRKGKQGE